MSPHWFKGYSYLPINSSVVWIVVTIGLYSSLGIGISTNHCAFLRSVSVVVKPKHPPVTIVVIDTFSIA
jgi:hypothetical protein